MSKKMQIYKVSLHFSIIKDKKEIKHIILPKYIRASSNSIRKAYVNFTLKLKKIIFKTSKTEKNLSKIANRCK